MRPGWMKSSTVKSNDPKPKSAKAARRRAAFSGEGSTQRSISFVNRGLAWKATAKPPTMRALTFRALKNANSSSKSFDTFTGDFPGLVPKLFEGRDPLVSGHLRPELSVRLGFLLEGGTFAQPKVHPETLPCSLQRRLPPGDPAEGLDVAVQGALHDLRRQLRGRRLLVPAGGVEPVADILLVEGDGLFAGHPVLDVPVAGGVGGEDFVDEQQLAGVHGVTELELGVGQEEILGGGVLGTQVVQLESQVVQGGGQLAPHGPLDGCKVHVLVVPRLGLGGRGEERLEQAARPPQAGGKREAADGARALVLAKAAAREGATRHA